MQPINFSKGECDGSVVEHRMPQNKQTNKQNFLFFCLYLVCSVYGVQIIWKINICTVYPFLFSEIKKML